MSAAHDVTVRPARHDDNAQVWPLADAFATSFTPQRGAFDATWDQIVDDPMTLLLVGVDADTVVGGSLMGGAERWAASFDAACLALASRRASAFHFALGYEDSATYFRKVLL